MFDPHTSYLGDRISAQAPGMRVDLVKNQADLELYHDQFEPYESVFDCRVFDLSDEGYQGTLFRFPFRSQSTSTNSKICQTVYTRELVSTLVQALKDQSNELLLFLKHVSKVSVSELETGFDPSAAREIFSVQRTGSSVERIKLIKSCSSLKFKEEKTCSTKFDIEVQCGTKKCTKTHWMLSSAIKTRSTDMQHHPGAEGLLPLAEVAIKIDPSGNDLKILPNSDSDASKVFCFLPLPIQCKLPFHVNGFFSIGKDRRNVSATDDRTFGSLWNKSLAEGALVTAFVNLLQILCRECDLKDVSNSEMKVKFLHCYYSLWNMNEASGLISTSFASAFRKCAPNLTCQIVWSEISGGCWLRPMDVFVFKDGRLVPKQKEGEDSIQQMIVKDVISVLLKHGYGIADLPYNVYDSLKKSLNSSSRVYDYKRFCIEIFFPTIDSIDPKVRDRNIKFLVKQFGAYFGKDNWYKWAESFLIQTPCISCLNSDILRPACELIDPTNEHFLNLFEANEGRFPSKELQESPTAMQGLRRLKMSTLQLNIVDLKDRAQSVVRLSEYEAAFQRSIHVCEYIDSVYGSVSSRIYSSATEKHKELEQLSAIPFLPVKQKPEAIDVPWSGKAKSFDSPSRMYSSEQEHLISHSIQ